jgi:hypothetical protein
MARKRGPQSYVRSSFPRTVNRIMSMKPKSLFLGHRVFTRGSRRPGRVHPLRRALRGALSPRLRAFAQTPRCERRGVVSANGVTAQQLLPPSHTRNYLNP